MDGIKSISQLTNRDRKITHQGDLRAKGSITSESVIVPNGDNNAKLSSTDLTFNDIPYNRNMINTILIYQSVDRTGDGASPATNLDIRNRFGYSGWYYKNTYTPETPPLKKRIKWYFEPQIRGTTRVSDIKGVVVNFFNGETTSIEDAISLKITTLDSEYITYSIPITSSLTENKRYQGVAICDISSVPFYNEIQIPYTISSSSSNFTSESLVDSIIIESNPASQSGNLEVVVSKLNIIMNNFTHKLLFVAP